MSSSINTIISGKYAGNTIAKSPSKNCAYIQGANVYINKLHVKSVNDINRSSVNSYGDAAIGTVLFGTGGAALGTNKNQILLEIEWVEGDKSLIKVSPEIQEAIIVGMYEDVSPASELFLKEADQKAYRSATTIALLLMGGCTLLYLIAGFSGS